MASRAKMQTTPMDSFMMRRPRPEFVLRAALAYACTQVGSGLLALGPAIAHSGWVGVPVLVMCGLCSAYTSYLLGWTIFRLQVHPSSESESGDSSSEESTEEESSSEKIEATEVEINSYDDVGEQALGMPGRVISLVVQALMLIGVCTIFLVLTGINAEQLEEIFGLKWLEKRPLILLAALLEVTPSVLMATVKETFCLTAFGAFCSAVCSLVILASAFTHDTAIDDCLDDGQENSWPFFTDFKGLSLSWNTIVFSFGGINVLPTLLSDFRQRGVLGRALVSFTWRSYLFIIFFYVSQDGSLEKETEELPKLFVKEALVAICGYKAGGLAMASQKVDSNVLIGLHGCSPSRGGGWDLIVPRMLQVAYAAILMHVLLAFPVPFHALAETIEAALGIRDQLVESSLCGRGLLLRVPRFLALGAFLAYIIPFFGALLNLVAALAGQASVFILPVLFSWAVQRQQGHRIRAYDWLLGAVAESGRATGEKATTQTIRLRSPR
ncbi:unnamed protein product [Durusdinium trenchii]|uniref:Amino acid transporter transmembrane domain-containing protein n=1 Tax=Durusdinium trenchii TaxID=1381693 RepID=A0ABP0JZY0_9DINO